MVRIDSQDSGSNYKFQDKMLKPNFSRSVFSLSHENIMSVPHQGSLIPIGIFETVPNDSFEISVSTLLRVLPQVVPLYTKQRITIHAFYSRMGDLFNNFSVFMTKGYSGNRVLKLPTLNEYLSSKFSGDDVVTSGDLIHYLYNVPIGIKYKDLVGKLSALPFMMYLRIWRDYFMNKNYYIDDRVMLPDADDTFRLNEDGELICDPQHTVDFSEWLYRDHADDRFTSAMPSPQRGDAPKLGYQVSMSSDGFPVYAMFEQGGQVTLGSAPYMKSFSSNSSGIFEKEDFGLLGTDISFNHGNISAQPHIGTWVDASKKQRVTFFADSSPLENIGIDITLNDIRQLAIAQTELERLARTDGSYQEFGLTFFGRASKNALDYQPLYIGGTYQPVIFSEVVQTSQSTETSAMGTYAGHGISQDNNGYIGKCDCDDYGYIMLVASIMPDTYYSQGIDKQFTRLYQADFFLPDRAKLGAQPIYNKELYFTGNPDQDDNLFAYQDIFDELRYMPNVVHGKLADPNELSFFPYTQSRYFTDLPTYSQSFATTKGNIRSDYLFAPNEVPYTAKFGINIRAVRPLPYQAVPAPIV